MTTRNYSSTAAPTKLSGAATDVQSALTVAATTGFPAAPFVLAIDAGATSEELVLVTAVAGTTLTVTRGYDSTSAQTHNVGAVVQHSHAAIDFRDAATHRASTAAHGVGVVVGVTEAQALSNKDLSSGTNTFPATLATDADVTTAVGTHAALVTTHGVTGDLVGTDDAQALTNKNLSSATNTFPNSVATLTGNQTLTNKDLSTGVTVGGGSDISGAWVSYTPTWTASGSNPTVGNHTLSGSYQEVGKTIRFKIRVVFGAGGYGTSVYSFTLPVLPKASTNDVIDGSAILYDTSAVSRWVSTPVHGTTSAGTFFLIETSTRGPVTSVAPITIASGDILSIAGSYEAV